jgi:hypothetical protein
MAESRKTTRRPVVQGARVFLGGGSPLFPCMILDLSDLGARLKIEADIPLPPQFILVMSRDGRLNRPCRIVWQEDGVVGVRFLSRKSIAVPKPAKESAGEDRAAELVAGADPDQEPVPG